MASAKVAPQENPQAVKEEVQKSAPKVAAPIPDSVARKATIEEAREFFKMFEFSHLRVLKGVLSEEIYAREKEAVNTAKAEIRKIAEGLGMSVEALMSIKSPKAPSNAPKKVGTTYRDPSDHTKVWHGMGARPQWFKDLLASGISLDSLRATS